MIIFVRNIFLITLVVASFSSYTQNDEHALTNNDQHEHENEHEDEQKREGEHEGEHEHENELVSVQKQAPVVSQVPTSLAQASTLVPMSTVTANNATAASLQTPNQEEELEITGIDTVGLNESQGNWLFKRLWWEKAEAKYEKAHELVQAVMDLRMGFFEQKSDLDKNFLDPFYLSVGLGQGELREIINTLIQEVEKERNQEGELDENERTFFETLQAEKVTLKKLDENVAFISELDDKIVDALHVLLKQIDITRGYEHDAWKKFKEISRTLSDIKAREIFFMMNTIINNISDVYKYINSEFDESFNQLFIIIKKQIEEVKEGIQDLKNKGIDLKVQFERLEAQKEADRQKEESEQPEPVEEQEVEESFLTTYFVQPLYYVGSMVSAGLKAVWNGLLYIVWMPIEKIMNIWRSPATVDENVDYQFLEGVHDNEQHEIAQENVAEDHEQLSPTQAVDELDKKQENHTEENQAEKQVEKESDHDGELGVPAMPMVPVEGQAALLEKPVVNVVASVSEALAPEIESAASADFSENS